MKKNHVETTRAKEVQIALLFKKRRVYEVQHTRCARAARLDALCPLKSIPILERKGKNKTLL